MEKPPHRRASDNRIAPRLSQADVRSRRNSTCRTSRYDFDEQNRSLTLTDRSHSNVPIFPVLLPQWGTGTPQHTSANRLSIKTQQQQQQQWALLHPMFAIPLTPMSVSTLPPIPISSMSVPASTISPAQAQTSAGLTMVKLMLASFPYPLPPANTDQLTPIWVVEVVILRGQHPQQLHHPLPRWPVPSNSFGGGRPSGSHGSC